MLWDLLSNTVTTHLGCVVLGAAGAWYATHKTAVAAVTATAKSDVSAVVATVDTDVATLKKDVSGG